MKNLLNIRSMKNFKNTIWILSIGTLIAGCEVEAVQKLPTRNFELVWSDEFDGDSAAALDTAKWNYDLGTGQNGWGNNELQSYTQSPQNVSLDGLGHLLITARKDQFGNYTSARIKTQGIFTQQYGRFEARIKTPTGAGIWPAFWMLGSNIDSVTWPNCGEIDIMEQKGKNSNITYGTIHGPGYSGGEAISAPYSLPNSRFDLDFYVYAVEWSADKIDFFVNDYLYKRITPADAPGEWVFNQPFFLILNVAVGGNFGGPPNNFTPFPGVMAVDYVRVYKSK